MRFLRLHRLEGIQCWAVYSLSVALAGMNWCGGRAQRPAMAADGLANPASSVEAVDSLKAALVGANGDRSRLTEQEFTRVALTCEGAEAAEKALWQDHVTRIRLERAAEMKARRVREGEHEMPFYYAVFGEKPACGRSLYISLHGGGEAPKAVNDQQWENQKRLYRPQEGVYFVPRAPTNTWNLWHQGHVDKLFDRVIENLLVFEGVDPNRVYLMGFSAGGDGVCQLAPRMADRLAAAAMMSGHPNEASPLGLRNIAFTLHAGGRDAAYNRNKVAREWGEKLNDLRTADPEGYLHWVKIYEQKGHWLDREDAAAVPWMARHDRKPLPNRVVWWQDDVTHSRFYWLAVDDENRKRGTKVIASYKGQQIDVKAEGIDRLTIRLNDRMLNLDEPITVVVNGQPAFEGRVNRSIAMLAKTLSERGDPRSVFSAEVTVAVPKAP